MNETNEVTSKAAEAANNSSGVDNVPASNLSYANPVALAMQNEPPPAYAAFKQNVAPSPMFPQVTRTQPMPSHMMFASPEAAQVNDYMVWSFFNCLCCCWPLGIVALVLSCVISEKKKTGDAMSARRLSKSTVILNAITTVLGIGLNIFAIIYYTQMR